MFPGRVADLFLQQLNTNHAARHQTLIDPDDLNNWSLHLTLDPEKSNEARTPVLHLESIAPIYGTPTLLSWCQ